MFGVGLCAGAGNVSGQRMLTRTNPSLIRSTRAPLLQQAILGAPQCWQSLFRSSRSASTLLLQRFRAMSFGLGKRQQEDLLRCSLLADSKSTPQDENAPVPLLLSQLELDYP